MQSFILMQNTLKKDCIGDGEIFHAPDDIAIFQEENQRWICTSGVYPLIQAEMSSNLLTDTGAFFLT